MTMDSFFNPAFPDALKRRLNAAILDAVSLYREDNEGNPVRLFPTARQNPAFGL